MKGFFAAGALATKTPLPLLAQCGMCGLYKGCQSPKMPVRGKGKKKLLIIGEAPGAEEDAQNRPFVGKTGQDLQDTLRKYGVEFFQDAWVTNSIICRPPKNELPPKAVDYCRPNVVRVIKELQPEKILLVGGAAVKSVLGWLWKEDPGGVGRWIGWQIPSQKLNAWVCPVWHPSFIQREETSRKGQTPIRLIWDRMIRAAVNLEGRPWKEPPDYAQLVRTVVDPVAAARMLRGLAEGDRPLAFDYETTTLKPDGPHAKIVSCAVSDGKVSVAYPWVGEARLATQEILRGSVPKIGANDKFEERWTLKEFGHGVKNWRWDDVLGAHVIDNRSEVTSVKFQAFVLLGQESYDEHIKPYLKSDNSNKPNRIRELDLPTLLRYNGMDAAVEWFIARKQSKKLGVEL